MNGYTSQPSFDEEGNFTGVEISSGHQPFNRSGIAPQGWSENELTGETEIFEETNTEGIDYEADYVDALHTLHPEIPDALAYLVESGVWDEERQAQHDKAVFDDDLSKVSEAVEKMLEEYRFYKEQDTEYKQNQPNSAPVEDDEDADIPDVSELYETEPNEELASEWDEVASQSDGAHQLMASLAARFHSGEVSDVDELMQIALDSDYSREQLIEAFNYFTQQTN